MNLGGVLETLRFWGKNSINLADVMVLQEIGCVFVERHTDASELWAEVSDRRIKQRLGVCLVSVKNVNCGSGLERVQLQAAERKNP